MEKIFTVDNPANPIRLVNVKPRNLSKYQYVGLYDALASDLIPDFQTKKHYSQKFSTSDAPTIQMLSDYDDITVELYDAEDDILVKTYAVTEVPNQILNETFKCYESIIDFSAIPEGHYQLVVSYKLDSFTRIYYYSECLDIKEVHEGTILIEYSNTENNFSMILDSGYKGSFRVESAILNMKANSDDEIYNDQKRNATTSYSLPYNTYQFIAGAEEGIPDWMVDKINRAFSFNILWLDGYQFNKVEGAQFEEKRIENYPYSGQTIEIMPVENGFLKQVNTSGLIPEDEDMIQYQKLLKYLANGSDIEISGVFGNGRLLEKIAIINRGYDFDLQVKTTTTGSQDDFDKTFVIEGITNTIVLDQLFYGSKTIQLIGLNSKDTDVYIWYKDSLAKPAGVTNAYGTLGINAVCIYQAKTQGEYDIDWNFATGLGREGTQWEGWAICDGRNNTDDMGGRFPIAYKDQTGGLFKSLISNTGGSFGINLAIDNLPKFRVKLFADVISTSGVAKRGLTALKKVARALASNQGSLAYEAAGTDTEATLGLSSEVGGGVEYNQIQPYIVSLFVKKIAEVA